jgi:hypothetical protein
MPKADESQHNERKISWTLIALIALFLLGIAVFSGLGSADPLSARVTIVLTELVYSGWMPAAYLFGAFGFGTLLRRCLPSDTPLPIVWSLGIALTLTLTHALGVLGMLNQLSAWIITGAGIILTLISLRGKQIASIERPTIAQAILLCCIVLGLALCVVAASSPPGALWDSEYGAYDSLSYHLQLPKEWIADARVWPKLHNVYSYHPGYIESAYAHLALLSGQRFPLQSTHFLSLGLVLISGWNVAAAIRNWTTSGIAPMLGFAMLLLTPWTIVVSTISYNESGVLALGAAALSLAPMTSVRPMMRGALLGVLVGAAVACKMTAIFFLAPSVAVILFTSSRREEWSRLTITGAIAGALMLLPWMIRNMIDTGNPVFPQLSGVFGSGHWTSEQLARYAGAHQFDGSVLDRLRLLILPDESASVHIARFRGLTNIQWGLLPALTLLALAVLLVSRQSRRLGAALLLAIILPIVAWIALTHLQSRFFVPMIPLAAIVAALGCSKLRPPQMTSPLLAIGAIIWSVVVFSDQNDGHPNALLAVGSELSTAPINIEGTPTSVTWTARVNELASEHETVYLLGDATPLYLRPLTIYNTTYDTPLLAAFIREHPDDPDAWVSALRGAGVDWIVVNRSELSRLSSSDWLDPSLSSEHLGDLVDTLNAYPSERLDASRIVYRITETLAQ